MDGMHRNSVALFDNSKGAVGYCMKYLTKQQADWDYYMHIPWIRIVHKEQPEYANKKKSRLYVGFFVKLSYIANDISKANNLSLWNK